MYTVATAHTLVNREPDRGRVSDAYREAGYRSSVSDPSLDQRLVARYVAVRLAEEKKREQISLRPFAKKYKVSHPYIKLAIDTDRAGDKVVRSFAAKHFGGSYDRLRDAAQAWADENGIVMDEESETSWLDQLPLPRMRSALEMAIDDGAPIEVLEEFAFRDWPKDAIDLPARAWWLRLQLELDDWRRKQGRISGAEARGAASPPKKDTPLPPSHVEPLGRPKKPGNGHS